MFKQYFQDNPDGVVNNRWGLTTGDPYDGEGKPKQPLKKDVDTLKKQKFWKMVSCPVTDRAWEKAK